MEDLTTKNLSLLLLREQQPRFTGLEAGHRACQGCGQALAARLVLEAAGPDTIIANATGCLEIFSSSWPESAWRTPWIHSLFENTAAVASGIEAAMKAQGRSTRVLAFAGDGGTFDIGFQARSGMLERNHSVLYVCFDNEAYMNTGVQRSGSTPHGAWTTTSPVGSRSRGKKHYKKDLLSIIAAHRIPYSATASIAYPSDLRSKVRKALGEEGSAFILIHSPCPLGWGHESHLSVEIDRLAVETGLFPLIEMEGGELTNVMPIRNKRPVIDYIRPQERFRHLLEESDEAEEERNHLQALCDFNIERYGLLLASSEPSSRLDSQSADTVRRGGARWA
jgi:pyruvate ferredoxin oxidoreductase beta subunit